MERIIGSVIFYLSLAHISVSVGQIQYTAPPLSTEAEKGFEPCPDTVFKFLFLKKVMDLGVLLPAWLPVVGYDEITILEGEVIPKPGSKHIDTHVSPSDFPFTIIHMMLASM